MFFQGWAQGSRLIAGCVGGCDARFDDVGLLDAVWRTRGPCGRDKDGRQVRTGRYECVSWRVVKGCLLEAAQ